MFKVQQIPLLVLANKNDLAEAKSTEQIAAALYVYLLCYCGYCMMRLVFNEQIKESRYMEWSVRFIEMKKKMLLYFSFIVVLTVIWRHTRTGKFVYIVFRAKV